MIRRGPFHSIDTDTCLFLFFFPPNKLFFYDLFPSLKSYFVDLFLSQERRRRPTLDHPLGATKTELRPPPPPFSFLPGQPEIGNGVQIILSLFSLPLTNENTKLSLFLLGVVNFAFFSPKESQLPLLENARSFVTFPFSLFSSTTDTLFSPPPHYLSRTNQRFTFPPLLSRADTAGFFRRKSRFYQKRSATLPLLATQTIDNAASSS